MHAHERIRSFTPPADHLATAPREERVDSAHARFFRVQFRKREGGAGIDTNATKRIVDKDCTHIAHNALRFLRIQRNCVALWR
jgi:hypothetical protein